MFFICINFFEFVRFVLICIRSLFKKQQPSDALGGRMAAVALYAFRFL
jgi:hypothetical protein